MRVVAITGGAQGIGRGIALYFAQAGYAVAIADPVQDAGDELVAMIKKSGGHALFTHADTSKEHDVDAWFETTRTHLGVPDVLINNAGIMIRKPFLELLPSEFDHVLGVNLRGAFLCAQAAARLMVERGEGGAIINIASTRAFMSEPDTESYSASKGGIVALTHAMAISLGPNRIRVNCVSPGWIETHDWQYSGRAEKPKHSKEDRDQHPVGRVGTPLDVAKACLYLAIDADFMTGQNMIIDGGMSVKMIYA